MLQCELNSSLVLSKNNLEWSNKQVWPSRFDTNGISMLRPLIEISVKMRIQAKLHATIVISSDEEEAEDEEVLNEEFQNCFRQKFVVASKSNFRTLTACQMTYFSENNLHQHLHDLTENDTN